MVELSGSDITGPDTGRTHNAVLCIGHNRIGHINDLDRTNRGTLTAKDTDFSIGLWSNPPAKCDPRFIRTFPINLWPVEIIGCYFYRYLLAKIFGAL